VTARAELSSIVSYLSTTFPGVEFHAEILIFNVRKSSHTTSSGDCTCEATRANQIAQSLDVAFSRPDAGVTEVMRGAATGEPAWLRLPLRSASQCKDGSRSRRPCVLRRWFSARQYHSNDQVEEAIQAIAGRRPRKLTLSSLRAFFFPGDTTP